MFLGGFLQMKMKIIVYNSDTTTIDTGGYVLVKMLMRFEFSK